MTLFDAIHERYVHPHRVGCLCTHVAELLPATGHVLDVGCGDGWLDRLLLERRPGLKLEGIDVLARPDAAFPVKAFDGRTLPYGNASVDVVLLVDTLHHATDPRALLREAARVARQAILIKDSVVDGPCALATLRWMDRIGNARHGVALPFTFWTKPQWMGAFGELGLTVEVWRTRLGLYPWPANLVFERSLHFVAKLHVRR